MIERRIIVPSGIQQQFEQTLPPIKILAGDTKTVIVFSAETEGSVAYAQVTRSGKEPVYLKAIGEDTGAAFRDLIASGEIFGAERRASANGGLTIFKK
ncbi:MAG TPA: hypothetical protein VE090_03955 [Methylomirabilota bacterium]|nr:hypothetical protein [Methylomirabilota bacterium]